MKTVDKYLRIIFNFFDLVSGYIILALGIMIVINAMLRALICIPILGTYEIITYSNLVVVSFLIGSCLYKISHVSVDFFIDKFSKRVRTALLFISELIAFLTFPVIIWSLVKRTISYYQAYECTDVLGIPLFLMTAVIILGVVLLEALLLFRIFLFLQPQQKS